MQHGRQVKDVVEVGWRVVGLAVRGRCGSCGWLYKPCAHMKSGASTHHMCTCYRRQPVPCIITLPVPTPLQA
jgi:hypothetical protein